MNENQGEIEINLGDILAVLLKRWWMILLVTLLCGALVFGYAYITYTPVYQSTAKMYVNNDASDIGNMVSISQSDIMAAQQLVNTYCQIIESRLTLEAVIKEAELSYTYEQLLSMISCGSVNETEVFYISVVCGDPGEAKAITNTIVKVLPEKITDVVEGSSVRTVDEAVEGRELSPGFATKAVIGAILGLILSCGIFFVLDILVNDTIQSEDWMADTYKDDIPLLAVIPDVNHSGGKRYGKYKYYRHSYYESKPENN
ncbi:MAG: hypothetical protein IJY04_07620 [Clostridia bacterium]|nr:hypothetical protein [Clostridia bacterium]